MNTQLIILFLIAFVILCVISYLVKSFVKLMITLAVIGILFGVGFLWNGQELSSNLGLDKVVSTETMNSINGVVNKVDEKREKNAVIDDATMQTIGDKIYGSIEVIFEGCGKFVQSSIDKLKAIFSQ